MMLAAFAVLTACGTVDQNIRARKNIQKCKFEFESIKLNKIEFDLVTPRQVNLDLYLEITNPAEDDVVLDQVDADIYLDSNKTTVINHKKFLRIKGNGSAVEKIELNIPASALLNLAGKRPETVTVDALIYVNILIGSFTLETNIAVPVKKTLPIPWDKINDAIEKQKGGAIEKAGEKADTVKEKAKDFKKGLKKKFK